jgi:UDP-N-acetylmuramoyl-L-alanyl-D-glutamate--2,6-diaminopimelate ligase
MGEAGRARSDLVVLTSDNPRTEDPLRILADIERGVRAAGARGASRRARPARARSRSRSSSARPGDLVLVAGKGHEDYQIVGTEKRPLDDREEVRRALARLA